MPHKSTSLTDGFIYSGQLQEQVEGAPWKPNDGGGAACPEGVGIRFCPPALSERLMGITDRRSSLRDK